MIAFIQVRKNTTDINLNKATKEFKSLRKNIKRNMRILGQNLPMKETYTFIQDKAVNTHSFLTKSTFSNYLSGHHVHLMTTQRICAYECYTKQELFA